MASSKRKFLAAEEGSEVPFQYDYADSDPESPSNGLHESDSDMSINFDYNEKSSSYHVHNSIISQPDV